jgi:hypothetical protein
MQVSLQLSSSSSSCRRCIQCDLFTQYLCLGLCAKAAGYTAA